MKHFIVLLLLLIGIECTTDINILFLYSLTRFENDVRIVNPDSIAAFAASKGLITQFNKEELSVTGDDYNCNVSINYTVVDTQSDVALTISQLGADLDTFDFIIGPSKSSTCVAVSLETSDINLPLISPSCTSSELDDKAIHPFFARTVTSDESIAQAFINLIQTLPTEDRTPILLPNSVQEHQIYSKVNILYQNDAYGTKYKDALLENSGEIEFVLFPFTPEDPVSISSALTLAAESETNIFIGIFNIESFNFFLEAALLEKLLGPNKLWMFSDGVLGANEINTLSSLTDEAIDGLNNNFFLQQTGRSLGNEALLNIFDEEFMQTEFGYNKEELLDELEVATNIEGSVLGELLDQFEVDGFKPSDSALFSYDALLSIREYIEANKEDENCSISFDGADVFNGLTNPLFSVNGLTGKVEFDITGSRSEETSSFKLVNLRFNKEEELVIAEDVTVGIYENNIWTYNNEELLFNNGGNKAPLLVDPFGSIEINILFLYSITRFENNIRTIDPVNTAAYVASKGLISQLNKNMTSVTGHEYNCPVNFSFTLIDTESEFSTALAKLNELDLNEYDFIIGPSRSTTCIPVSFVTSPFNLPIISPSCTTPELDDTVSHRFFARTIASDESTAKAMVALIKTLPTDERKPDLLENSGVELQVYTKVNVLYQEDSYGSKYKDALFENRDDIEFLFFPFKPEDPASIESAIELAAENGVNVFIGIFNLESLDPFVAAALRENLMGENRVWIFTDGVLGAEEVMGGLTNNFGVSEEILASINNSFFVQATGRTDKNTELLEVFDSQFMEADFGYNRDEITSELDVATDDAITFVNVLDQFEQPNFEPSDFSLFAYDAILAIREYIDANVEDDQCTISFDGADVITGLTREQFKFDGLTGEVQFNENGARTVKTSAVKVANIRFYKVASSVGDFKAEDVTVGLFDGNFWNLQNDMLFTGGSSKAPLLVDPPTDISRFAVNDDIKIATVTLGAFTLVTVGLMFLFIFKSKKKNVIKAAQPMFLNIMLVGIILSTVSVFVLPRENAPDSDGEEGTSFNCNIPFFLISLGVTISYAGLIFKLQRVVKVANTTPELRDNKVYTMWDSMKSVIIIVIMNIALIIAAYIHNPLVLEQRIIEEDEFGQPLETFDICVPDSNGKGEVYGVLLLFHSLFYFYGFRLICKTRGLSTDFQEGKWIAISVISQFQLYLLGIPVVVAVGQEEPGIRYLVVSLIVIFSNLILMSLIFIPKMYRVFTGDDEVVWSDRGINSGLQHYSTRNAEESRKYQSVRKSLFNTMATQDFGHEVTL